MGRNVGRVLVLVQLFSAPPLARSFCSVTLRVSPALKRSVGPTAIAGRVDSVATLYPRGGPRHQTPHGAIGENIHIELCGEITI